MNEQEIKEFRELRQTVNELKREMKLLKHRNLILERKLDTVVGTLPQKSQNYFTGQYYA